MVIRQQFTYRAGLKVLFVAFFLILFFCPVKVCQAVELYKIPSSYTGVKKLFDKEKARKEKEPEKIKLKEEEIEARRKLPPEKIQALTSGEIETLTPEQIQAFAPGELRAFLPEQLRLFSEQQLRAIPANGLWALSREQLLALAPNQIQAFTPEQVKALSFEQKRILFREVRSDFEKFVAGVLPEEISPMVSQFGYDLFRKRDQAFLPFEYVPVSPEYVIGPGDEIKINLWGKVEEEYLLEVDRDGKITIPSVGVLSTAGLTFKELKEVLRKKFQQYFSGCSVNVTLSRIRTIRIYVVGKAKNPGSYNVSGMSTLINALFMTGGPSKIGSMRHIRLIRNHQLITELDLYDFILKADKSKDARLEPGDVIFIPHIEDLVAVVGNVKDPAIYELKDETRLMDLLESIGGISATGYLRRIQVERIEDSQFKKLIDKDLSEFIEEDNIILKNGDIIKVFPVSTVVVNKVTLKGNVVRPGDYEWHEGMKINDIIPSRDLKVLKEDTLLEFARIERRIPPDFHPEVVHFNLGKATEQDPRENVELKPFDVVTVFNKWEVKEKPVVCIAGAVNIPDTYEYREGMKLSDLIKLAGGLKRYAYNQAELTRVHITRAGPVTERSVLDISRKPDRTPEEDTTLRRDDYVFVKTIPDWHLYYQVAVRGEVRFPGTYPVKKGERLADLLERAGGFTENVYLKGSLFTRKSVQETQQKMLEKAIDRLEQEVLSAAATKTAAAFAEEESRILEAQTRQYRELIKKLRSVRAIGRLVISIQPLSVLRDTPANVELEDGDEIFIPSRLSTINVMGSVYNPSTYIYDPETRIDSYIEVAGGPSENADTDRTYVIKVDGSALSHKKIKGSFFGWSNKTYRWEVSSLSKTKLDPGDTIIVPEKFDRLALMRNIKDISQMIFQMAVTAGVVVNLF